jgi:hypothetical protein
MRETGDVANGAKDVDPGLGSFGSIRPLGLASVAHRDNLAATMFSGRKRPDDERQ